MALPKPTPVNETDRLKGNVIFFIVSFFIFYIFYAFLKFIFSPFKVLSPKEAADKVDAKINEKRNNRWDRKLEDPNDPMVQFHLRFVEKVEEYKKNPDNEAYFAWFQEWQDGNIIDSELKYAPSVFDEDSLEMRPNFIHYMKIQLDLHKRASLIKRMQFTTTLFRFYPELSANLRGLEEDLAQYDAEISEREAEELLQKEIQAFGLPEPLAEYLANKDISAAKLREEAMYLKKCMEKCEDPYICITALENKIPSETTSLKIIKRVVEDFKLPERAAIALLKEEIISDDLVNMAVDFDSHRELIGEPDEATAKELLNKYRGKKLLKKLNQEN